MGETQGIITTWRRALARGERVALATVVHVQGSSYRKPGARMLVTGGGERSGTVSGGCLEAEVARKIWWLTAHGPAVQQYQSSFDEDGGGLPWGLGCGGTVWLLLERDATSVLTALAAATESGTASVIVSGLDAPAGTLCVTSDPEDVRLSPPLRAAVARCLREQRCFSVDANGDLTVAEPAYFVEFLRPPPRLTIFGAGDDAQPIARFAEALGWRVAIADGRSNLLRRERFPEALELRQIHYRKDSTDGAPSSGPEPAAASYLDTGVSPGELGVILTHSFDQDGALLRALLPARLLYLGILGPRHRTERLLDEVAPALGWSREECWAQLHAPVGLDLGARDPAGIALAIVADLQAVLTGRRVEVLRRQERPSAEVAASHG